MALSLSTTTNASRAAGVISDGKQRFVHFSHHFSDTQLVSAHLKHWSSSFASGGTTYKFSMVGTNPKKGSATTTVPVTIMPLRLTFSNGKAFDGTTKVPETTGSPIFQDAQFISGSTQYGDAIQRAEFWKSVSTTSPNYHVLVGTPKAATALSLAVPKVDVANWISPTVPQYGCSIVREVGDPLVGIVFFVSGLSGSHLQDEAFFSLFARQTPSIAINGLYTYLGTFKALSQHC